MDQQSRSVTVALVAFVGGQFISSVGSRINAVALPLLTIERYGIGLSLGLVTATRLVPRVVLGPLAGALADRLPRRATLAATHLASAGLVAAIPLTTALWHLYLLGALVGIVEALLRPARFAIQPDVVPRDLLYRVNAAEEVLDALSNLVGPTLAVALIATFTASGAFWTDALSYVIGAACLLALRPLPVSEAADAPAATVSTDHSGTFRPIWRLLRADPVLGLLLGVNAVYTLGIGVLLVLYAPLALGIGAGERGFGAIVTATGAGALLGTALAPRLGPRLTPPWLLAALALSGLLLVAGGLATTLWPILALLLLAHAPESLCYLVFATESQRRVPAALLGRYHGVGMSLLAVVLPLGNLIGGLIVARADPHTGIIGVGVGFVALAVALGPRPRRGRSP